MYKIKVIFPLLVSIVALLGCATKPNKDWPWQTTTKGKFPWQSKEGKLTQLCGQVDCTREHAFENMQKALRYCHGVYTDYSNTLHNKNKWSSGVGIAGTLAGIFSPTAAGTSQAVLSSFSGATNAVQVSTTGLFNAAASNGTMNTVYVIYEKHFPTINKKILEGKFTEASISAYQLANECGYAPSIVNSRMVQAAMGQNVDAIDAGAQDSQKKPNSP